MYLLLITVADDKLENCKQTAEDVNYCIFEKDFKTQSTYSKNRTAVPPLKNIF